MSITILRWKSGAAGDTILKMILDSYPNIKSQNRYNDILDSQTLVDYDYVKNFAYSEIAKMSFKNYNSVDQNLLDKQLEELNYQNTDINWMLKTHCYFDFNYRVIDIIIDRPELPFAVKASLYKNSRFKNLVPDYNALAKKIKNEKILYKFDCFNYAKDILYSMNISKECISLKDILSGWASLTDTLTKLNFVLSDNCQDYYTKWLADNQCFIPSSTYIDLVQSNNFDYNNKQLTIEERYCLLAIAEEKFKILS